MLLVGRSRRAEHVQCCSSGTSSNPQPAPPTPGHLGQLRLQLHRVIECDVVRLLAVVPGRGVLRQLHHPQERIMHLHA